MVDRSFYPAYGNLKDIILDFLKILNFQKFFFLESKMHQKTRADLIKYLARRLIKNLSKINFFIFR